MNNEVTVTFSEEEITSLAELRTLLLSGMSSNDLGHYALVRAEPALAKSFKAYVGLRVKKRKKD